MNLMEAIKKGQFFKRKKHDFYFTINDVRMVDGALYMSEFASMYLTPADVYEKDWEVVDSRVGAQSFFNYFKNVGSPKVYNAWKRRQKFQ